jgi:hypothetical protein
MCCTGMIHKPQTSTTNKTRETAIHQGVKYQTDFHYPAQGLKKRNRVTWMFNGQACAHISFEECIFNICSYESTLQGL